MIPLLKEKIILAVFIWIVISVTSSSLKAGAGNCGNDYQIDYVFNTNLFCEIKP